MTDRVEVHDKVFTNLLYQFDSADVESNDRIILAIDKALRAWRDVTDLDEFNFMRTAPSVYSYEVKHKDARLWTGVIDFTANPKDPHITIIRADTWSLLETERVDLYPAIIDGVLALGMVSIEATFT